MHIKRISKKIIAIVLAVSLTVSSMTVPGAAADQLPTATNTSSYTNPYVTASLTGAARSETVPNATLDSLTRNGDTYYIGIDSAGERSGAAQFAALAAYSRTHDLTGKTFVINDPNVITLPSTFIGIGSAEHPFSGTLSFMYDDTDDVQASIVLDGCSALFSHLSSSATISHVRVTSSDASGCLAQTLHAGTTPLTLSIVYISGTVNNTFTGEDAGMLFGTVLPDGASTATTVNLSSVFYSADSGSTYSVTAARGNAGGLIGSVSGMALTLTGAINMADYTVSSTMGNTGLLVGRLNAGASLITGNVTLAQTGTDEAVTAIRYVSGATDIGGNVGAVAGSLAAGSTLTTGAVSISGLILGGGNAAGGVVGNTEQATIAAASVTISGTTVRGAVHCGGYIGNCVNTTVPVNNTVQIGVTAVPTNDTSFGLCGAGALFGRLEISGNVTIASANNTVTFQNDTNANGTAGYDNICIGGLIGIYTATALSDTLTLSGTAASALVTTSGFFTYGGIIGLMAGGSYCQMNSMTESTGTETAGTQNSGDLYVVNYGGAAGYISDGAVLDINSITVRGGFCVRNTTGNAGGIAGYAGNGAVVRLRGTTTLSTGAYGKLTTNYAAYSGQIVGYQDYALIYADTLAGSSWTLVRNLESSSSYGMDDIGNDGAVIRNNAVHAITFNETTHAITLSQIANATAAAITLTGLTDYAALAITLHTHGFFSALSGTIDNDNYDLLLDAEISLNATDNIINLTGSGITSLNRNDENDAFTGTLKGNNHTVTLAIGETYATGGTHGNGEIYGHQYVGMFSVVGNTARFENLSLDGVITYGTFANTNSLRNDHRCYAGGVAGYASGSVTMQSVTTSITVTGKNSRRYNSDDSSNCFGGLIGYYTGASLTANNCTGSANIYINNTHSNTADYHTNYTGGLIGRVVAANNASLQFVDTKLSGTISMPTTAEKCALICVGGLISNISAEDTSPLHAVSVLIQGLTIDDQTISVMAANATGGLLGYIWSNVNVTLEGSTAHPTNTINGSVSIDASCPGVFGGLVYQIDGKFSVSNTTLTGEFIGNHSSLDRSDALFVSQGINLYMVVDKPTVSVLSSVDVTESSTGRCDELVGNNIASATNNGAQNGGILSIETGHPVGSTASPWAFTITNGNANKNTRYYYNVEALDKNHSGTLLTTVTGGSINTKQALLLWHILNYTAHESTVQPAYYFLNSTTQFSTNNNYTIGANIDVSDGFCLYPTTVAGGSYAFGGKSLTFSNTAVSTLNTRDSSSQHYLMQTGLFYNVNGSLSVTGLTLSGNVGMWAGNSLGSGALVMGTVTGSHVGTTVTRTDLILTDIVLNNLTVNGCNTNNNYAPLFINRIRTCVSANISHVTQQNYPADAKAGSSLIGNVGFINENNDSAIQLKLDFDRMILDGNLDTSIFYRASFMQSFTYLADGSSNGRYNFNQAEDWTNATTEVHNVTYGAELEAKGTEYLDTPYKVHPSQYQQTTVYDRFAEDYLPYVASVDTATSKYAIDVNLKSGDLDSGCGTYEDPYVIKTVNQLMAVYSYLEDGTLRDGWVVNAPNDSFCESKTDHTAHTYSTASPTTFTNVISQTWLAKAYYTIDNDIDLSGTSYTGFGNTITGSVPFAGVIVGNNNTVTMPTTANLGAMGFVKVGNGCVLKNIKVEYAGVCSVASTSNSYFGGAIGTIIGGDNILDGVSVTLAQGAQMTVNGRTTYVGGYVGLDMSGGVVFRNMNTAAGLTFTGANDTYFYCNPYVGRVLDGYAIAEQGTQLDNTEKNYKIPTLSADGTFTDASNNTVHGVSVSKAAAGSNYKNGRIDINSAEGLLIFSAAMNSGALSASEVQSYGGVAHVRNALYSGVGTVTGATDSDYLVAQNDNQSITSTKEVLTGSTKCDSTSSVPYLVKKYFGNTADSQYSDHIYPSQRLAGNGHNNNLYINADCDVSGYANGFRGVGGRYASYANLQVGTTSTRNDSRYNLVGSLIDGGSHTIKMDVAYTQYAINGTNALTGTPSDETYSAKDVGLFRNINLTSNLVVQNLTISGKIENNLVLSVNGNPYACFAENYFCGGLFGATAAKNGSTTPVAFVTLNAVKANQLSITACGITGGLIGNILASTTLTNCSYDTLNMTARTCIGGLVGCAYSTATNYVYLNIDTTENTTMRNLTLVNANTYFASSNDNDTIFSGIGGIVGWAGRYFTVNNSTGSKLITLDNINISMASGSNPRTQYFGTGGVVGRISGFRNNISNVTVQNSSIAGTEYSLSEIQDTTTVRNNGCAGGIVGTASNRTASSDCPNTVTNCTVNNTNVFACYSSAGIVGDYRMCYSSTAKPGTLTMIGCTVENNTLISSYYFAAGMVGNVSPGVKNAATDNKTKPAAINISDMSITGSTIYSAGADNARAGGIIAYTSGDITLMTANTTQNTISNTRILSKYVAGAISKPASDINNNPTKVTLHDLTINNCQVGAIVSSGSIGGIVNSDNTSGIGTTYLKNITFTNNTLCGYNINLADIGGLQNNVFGGHYANNVLSTGNTIGRYTGTEDIFTYTTAPDAFSSTGSIGKLAGTVSAGGSMYVTAYHGDPSQTPYRDIGTKSGSFAVVYADYKQTLGETATSATLGAQIPISPSKVWAAGETWIGDGVAAGVPQEIYTDGDYAAVDALTTLDDTTNLESMNNYYPTLTAAAQMPLLYVKGAADTLITEYLNLLTNGGFSAFETVNSANLQVTSQAYDITSTGITKHTGDAGSIAYADGAFQSVQNYDKITTAEGGRFTVLTVTFTNTASATENLDYTIHVPLYYPQILTVQSNVSLKDSEEYSISNFVGHPSVSVSAFSGGTFSAYFEYVYNELRLEDPWNYAKSIKVMDSENRLISLPAECNITLLDLNSPTAAGYRSYYYHTTSALSEIPFSAFSRMDAETGFTVSNLNVLPAYTGGGLYRNTTGNPIPAGYGIERYIAVIQLPESSGSGQQVYYLGAGLDETAGTTRNVRLESDHDYSKYITIWPKPTITGDFTANNGQTTISTASPVSVQLNLDTSFTAGYSSIDSTQYGFVRYYLTDNNGHQINFPARSSLTLNGDVVSFTSDTMDYLYAITDAGGHNLNLTSGYALDQAIQLDFSSVPAATMNTLFNGTYYLCADYLLASDYNYPGKGLKTTRSIPLITAPSVGASLAVSVALDDQLHLGINPGDAMDETNNGIIDYSVTLSLAECSQEDIERVRNGEITFTFTLSKKNDENGYTAVTAGDYLSVYQTTIKLTRDERNALCDSPYHQLSQPLQIKVNTPTALADYANYKYQVTAQCTGGYSFTVMDHFIYTLAQIQTEFVD